VFTEVGVAEFAKQYNIPEGSLYPCISTGLPNLKHNIAKAWRP
jgi:predicted transcriptional regulator